MVQSNITVDEQKSEAIQPLETLFNFNNSFTVFVWLRFFQPLGPKGGGAWPKWPNGEYASGYSDILVNNETLVPVPFSRVRGPSVTRPKFLGPLPTPKRLYLQRPSVVW